jgi:hypothetical protein
MEDESGRQSAISSRCAVNEEAEMQIPNATRIEMRRNYSLFRKETQEPYNAQVRETLAYLLLKLLDPEFTREVVQIRKAHAQRWRTLPPRSVLRRGAGTTGSGRRHPSDDDAAAGGSAMLKALDDICARYRIGGLVVAGNRFLPWISSRHQPGLLEGEKIGGRHAQHSLARLRRLEMAAEAFVAHHLEGKKIADIRKDFAQKERRLPGERRPTRHATAEESISQALRRLRRLIEQARRGERLGNPPVRRAYPAPVKTDNGKR